MIRIGVIGCGWIVEKAHIPAIIKNKSLKLNSVFDKNIERSKYIAEKYAPVYYSTLEEFLESPIDAVIIATTNNSHSYYTDAALKAKKHILCEKPIALSSDSLKRSYELGGDNNKIIFPLFVNRFRQDVLELYHRVLNNKIGEVLNVNAKWVRTSGIPRPGTWITNKEFSGGGVLQDLGSHMLDLSMMFFIDPQIESTTLSCKYTKNIEMKGAQWCENISSSNLDIDVETAAMGCIKLASNKTIDFHVSWDDNIPGDVTEITITGKKGRAILKTLFGFSQNGLYENSTLIVEGEQEEQCIYKRENMAMDAFDKMYEYIVGAIVGIQMDYLNMENVINVVTATEKLYHSLNS